MNVILYMQTTTEISLKETKIIEIMLILRRMMQK